MGCSNSQQHSKHTPVSTVDAQPQAIKDLQDTIDHWEGYTKAPMATDDLPCRTLSTKRHRAPRVPTEKSGTPPSPRVNAPPSKGATHFNQGHQKISQRLRYQMGPKQLEPATTTEQLVTHCTRYLTTQQTLRVQPVLAAQNKYPEKLLNLWCTPKPEEHTAMPVLDNETGESLEYNQLRRQPKYKKIWNISYSNELGRIF